MICENYSPVVASSQCVTGIDHESLVVLFLPPGLIFKNSMFCAYSVCMCFVWFSEPTATTSV